MKNLKSLILLVVILISTTINADVIFFDDFESFPSWNLTGEFEIAAPTGLGGEHGNPDPITAFSGTNVLGVDLTGLGAYPGDYEPDLGDREYTAESPIVDCTGYMNVTLEFQRFLNVEIPAYDHAYIDVWDGSAWVEIYTNVDAESDTTFSLYTYDVPQAINNADFKVRFSMGATDDSWLYSGWNIDDVVVNGTPIVIPTPTTLVAPTDGETDVTFTGSLEWNQQASAVEYLVYFGTDNPPSTLVTTTSDLTYDYSNLNPDTQYFWQVVPSNPLGQASDCPIWSFTTLIDQWQYITVDDATIEVTFDYAIFPYIINATEYAHLTNSSLTLEGTYVATLISTTSKRFDTPAIADKSKSETNASSSQISHNAAKKVAITRDQFDGHFIYDVTTASGVASQAGVETDGEFIYTTVWNSADFCKYDMNGNYIETFQVAGASNVRDLAYDGQYFYGADATAQIFEMDFESQTLVSIISGGGGTRAIAYDEGADAFWVNNWDSDMLLVDRNGDTIGVISGIISTYGAAYDNYSEGGPYLWIQKGTDGAAPLELIQYDITSGSMTGLSHSGYAAPGGNAGGLFISEGFVDGTVTIGALSQGEAIFGFELAEATHLVTVVNPVGVIPSNSSTEIELFFDISSLVPTKEVIYTFTYDLVYTDEFGLVSQENTEIILTFIPPDDIDEQNTPLATTLHQNYPNPFNPITKINYTLPNTNFQSAKIVIHNSLGQQVWSSPLTHHTSRITDSILFDGSKFNSGIYYYSLIVDGKKLGTKSMVLIK